MEAHDYNEESDWNGDEENSHADYEDFSDYSNEQNDNYSDDNDSSDDFDSVDSHLPLGLIFRGNLEQAKQAGTERNKWLLVNVQSEGEINSVTLNRDTWRDEFIGRIVESNFVFVQVYNSDTLGEKISYFYNLASFPVTLVIHPITGQKMDCWTGMIQPEDLKEKLSNFIDFTPQQDILQIINRRSECREQEEQVQQVAQEIQLLNVYPPLPEEPEGDRNLCCRITVRIPPDGRRIQRNFLLSDPIQLLWSFCFSELDEELKKRRFRLMIQRAAETRCTSEYLESDSNLSFKESGVLSKTLILATFE